MSMLIAYDAEGRIIATLDRLNVHDAEGRVIGLRDFEAIEAAGRELTDVWTVAGAKGSKTWPEWIKQPTSFRVELAGPAGRKHIAALVHADSGQRRERTKRTVSSS